MGPGTDSFPPASSPDFGSGMVCILYAWRYLMPSVQALAWSLRWHHQSAMLAIQTQCCVCRSVLRHRLSIGDLQGWHIKPRLKSLNKFWKIKSNPAPRPHFSMEGVSLDLLTHHTIQAGPQNSPDAVRRQFGVNALTTALTHQEILRQYNSTGSRLSSGAETTGAGRSCTVLIMCMEG